MSVVFLSEPSLGAEEAVPELGGALPSERPELLVARAGNAKEWLGVLGRLEAMGLGLRQTAWRADDALVAVWIAGATENPEPLTVVADLILLGGGWPLLRQVLAEFERSRSSSRADRLQGLAAIPGVYVPSLYKVEYTAEGTIARVTPDPGIPSPAGLSGGAPFPETEGTGYRRYFVGEPRGGAERIAEAIKRERHQERTRLKREPPPVSVSLTCLVPWPWGAYQWAPMATERQLKEEIRLASRLLARIPGVQVTHDQPKWALLEGVLRMGDRRAGELLLLVHRLGWDRAQVASPLNPAFILHRWKARSEVLPWDHVDWGLDRDRLWGEFERLCPGPRERGE